MKRLLYGSSSQTLRLDFPDSWRASVPTGVNLVIKDNAGTELVASTAATINAPTTLAAAVVATNETCTFAANVVAWAESDRFHIASGDNGPAEDMEILSYNGTTEVVTLKQPAKYGHASGAVVNAFFGTYAFNISTTTTYTKGKELTVTWTPNNGMTPVTERYEIVIADFELQDIQEKFSILYSNEYDNIREKWDLFYDMSVQKLRAELTMDGYDLSRLKDPSIMEPAMLPLLAYQANMSMGGDSRVVERDAAFAEYTRLLAQIKQSHNWFDVDQDDVVDEGEVGPIVQMPPERQYI